ncbi:MAG: alpha/beta hydrolase [Bacteroidota bacterium]
MEKIFHYKDKNIRYIIEGEGNVVILLHGFTESLNIWDDYSVELTKTNKLLRIDLPGHGKSDCIGDVQTMEEMAELVNSICEAENLNQMIMIGHSMGGYVMLAFAEKYAEKLKGFGLFHSIAFADNEEQKNNRARAIEVIRNNHHGFLSAFIPELFAECNREKYKKEIEVLIETSRSMSEQSVISCMEGMRQREDKTHVLKEAKFPVLFIGGYEDVRVPIAKFKEQMLFPPESTALLMTETGHMGYIEQRDKTLEFIKKYIIECNK